MAQTLSTEHPLHRWFSGLVENALYSEVGLCDPALADYLSVLLVDFIHMDRIFPFRDDFGRPIAQIADMLSMTQSHAPAATREAIVHRHIGDFTLFWTGIYPENLKRLCARDHRDHFIDYFRQGKRSYAIASELSAENTAPPASLLRRLSDHFEYCVYGLGAVRREVRACEAESRSAGLRT